MGSQPVSISASRGAGLLGVSRYKGPVQAWAEIMEERIPGFCDAHGILKPVRVDPFAEPLDPKLASLRWGTAFEGAICDLIGGLTDRECAYISPLADFVTCHIDGRDSYGMLNENKTAMDMAFRSSWGEPGSEMVPLEIQVQCQHQLICTGDREARVNLLVFPRAPAEFEKDGFSILSKQELFEIEYWIAKNGLIGMWPIEWAKSLKMMGYFHHYKIIANEKAQKEMLDRYRYIWEKNILGETPPPANGYDDLRWMFAAPEGEIEASNNIRELWQESIDIDNEIDSMIKRKDEIKDIFAQFVSRELLAKNIRKGGEPRKLNVYAGPRKLFSISRPEPGVKVSRSSADRMKEDYPELYEEMKVVSFAEILGDVELTEKQKEDGGKYFGKLKLAKILSRDSIIHAIERNKPELFATLKRCAIVEDTEPVARLTIKKPGEE